MARLIRAEIEQLELARESEDELAEERELCTESFKTFIQHAWPHVESNPLVWSWHNDAIADHLTAVTSGEIQNLIINVPPGSTKTLTVQVLWVAWEWICNQHRRSADFPDGFRPNMRYIAATYAESLARDKSLLCRKLVSSPWYQTLFEERWQRDPEQWSTLKFGNRAGGWRMATSVGAQATGQHADRKILDDPVKPQDVRSNVAYSKGGALELAWHFWTQTMSSRNTGPHAAEIVIMQRLHQKDVVGRCMSELVGKHEVLCIPQLYEPKHPIARRTVLKRDAEGEPIETWSDPRTEEGELMCPERFPRKTVDEQQRILGPQGFAAQQQQRPAPAGGALYKQHHFRHWTVRPRQGVWILVGDCTFKDLDTSDYVALQVWCGLAPDFYLIDQIRDRLDVLGTCDAIATLRSRYPTIGEVIIEDAANGPAVVQIMKKAVPSIVLVGTEGGKYARANATSVHFANGNVYLPPLERAPWVRSFIDEHLSFPVGANDDQVDAQSHALVRLSQGMANYEAMLETMRKMGIEP